MLTGLGRSKLWNGCKCIDRFQLLVYFVPNTETLGGSTVEINPDLVCKLNSRIDDVKRHLLAGTNPIYSILHGYVLAITENLDSQSNDDALSIHRQLLNLLDTTTGFMLQGVKDRTPIKRIVYPGTDASSLVEPSFGATGVGIHPYQYRKNLEKVGQGVLKLN